MAPASASALHFFRGVLLKAMNNIGHALAIPSPDTCGNTCRVSTARVQINPDLHQRIPYKTNDIVLPALRGLIFADRKDGPV